MQARSFGKVAPTSAGTPVRVTTDTSLLATRIRFQAISANTGKAYLGTDSLNTTTLAGCIAEFAIPGSSQPPAVEVFSGDGSNSLRPADYYVDAVQNNEGLVVSYWLR